MTAPAIRAGCKSRPFSVRIYCGRYVDADTRRQKKKNGAGAPSVRLQQPPTAPQLRLVNRQHRGTQQEEEEDPPSASAEGRGAAQRARTEGKVRQDRGQGQRPWIDSSTEGKDRQVFDIGVLYDSDSDGHQSSNQILPRGEGDFCAQAGWGVYEYGSSDAGEQHAADLFRPSSSISTSTSEEQAADLFRPSSSTSTSEQQAADLFRPSSSISTSSLPLRPSVPPVFSATPGSETLKPSLSSLASTSPWSSPSSSPTSRTETSRPSPSSLTSTSPGSAAHFSVRNQAVSPSSASPTEQSTRQEEEEEKEEEGEDEEYDETAQDEAREAARLAHQRENWEAASSEHQSADFPVWQGSRALRSSAMTGSEDDRGRSQISSRGRYNRDGVRRSLLPVPLPPLPPFPNPPSRSSSGKEILLRPRPKPNLNGPSVPPDVDQMDARGQVLKAGERAVPLLGSFLDTLKPPSKGPASHPVYHEGPPRGPGDPYFGRRLQQQPLRLTPQYQGNVQEEEKEEDGEVEAARKLVIFKGGGYALADMQNLLQSSRLDRFLRISTTMEDADCVVARAEWKNGHRVDLKQQAEGANNRGIPLIMITSLSPKELLLLLRSLLMEHGLIPDHSQRKMLIRRRHEPERSDTKSYRAEIQDATRDNDSERLEGTYPAKSGPQSQRLRKQNSGLDHLMLDEGPHLQQLVLDGKLPLNVYIQLGLK
eukprot:gene12517-15732_t